MIRDGTPRPVIPFPCLCTRYTGTAVHVAFFVGMCTDTRYQVYVVCAHVITAFESRDGRVKYRF